MSRGLGDVYKRQAYDVDKVVEQLEVGLANECVYERDQKVYTEAIRCAIEIVKGGGVNE